MTGMRTSHQRRVALRAGVLRTGLARTGVVPGAAAAHRTCHQTCHRAWPGLAVMGAASWRRPAFVMVVVLMSSACAGPQRGKVVETDDVAAVGAVLDAFHAAAARADGDAYFACMASDGVFIGTDPGERWTRAEFEAYCRPYFDQGTGWTYRPRNRHVTLGPPREGEPPGVAWFDEHLDNDKYGLCRGSGVLVRSDQGWLIALYRLGLEVPNEAASAVVAAIAAGGTAPVPAAASSTTIILVRHAEKQSGADPALTAAGRLRAEHLVGLLERVPLDAIYATRTNRTRATVAPIAAARDVEVVALDPADDAALVERLRGDHRGAVVLVCGHSNTLPAILRRLGVRERVVIPESHFDDVFIVTLPAAGAAVMTHLRVDTPGR
ncbi:MAG: nuclear transport factor 2 family protein [Planctomycetota bacterium]